MPMGITRGLLPVNSDKEKNHSINKQIIHCFNPFSNKVLTWERARWTPEKSDTKYKKVQILQKSDLLSFGKHSDSKNTPSLLAKGGSYNPIFSFKNKMISQQTPETAKRKQPHKSQKKAWKFDNNEEGKK